AAVQARARQAGMQGVLGKPIDPAALQRALSAALEGRSTAPAAPPPAPAADLLSTTRIENFRRLGLLDDLLPRALLDLRRHVQSLEQAATSDDREGVSAALHALVGLAGEVGAQALHARARERYAGWLEGQRPGGEAWTRELRELLEATERALWQYCGVRAERVPPLG
ncbi:Hpt domain-containing protein, partial [Hydrogenophaga borbori]|uniref:Hpt domain-containing protein n=1 Tax=Hydrogenophaga borbori TaxID=2294117 RepID=UPI00301DEB6F